MFENKLEQEIIGLYAENLVNLFSINEISKKLNKKYPYINKKVTQLINKGILKKIVVGRSYLCSLNLENEKTILLLALYQINKKDKDSTGIREYIIRNNLELAIHSVVSFQGGLVFIVNSLRDRKTIMNAYPNAQIVHKAEFADMLLETPSLFRNHLVIYGYERFFELIISFKDELISKYSPLRY
ncbi:MAG: hypothetical protein ACOCQG_01915 [Candidatus Nanoarchaeia archaeon]